MASSTVSIVMAAYNGGKFIERQIDSIIRQLTNDDELIIIDDCSTDDTWCQITTISRPHKTVSIHRNHSNIGVIRSFELGLTMVAKNIVILADQDDIFMPNRVAFCRQYFETNKDVALIIQDCIQVNEQLQVIDRSLFKLLNSDAGLLKNLYKNTYLGATMSFRTEILAKILPFPKCIPMHDIWIGLVANLFYKIRFIPEPAIYFVRHGANYTPANTRLLTKIRWRTCLILNLIRISIVMKQK